MPVNYTVNFSLIIFLRQQLMVKLYGQFMAINVNVLNVNAR